MPEVFVGKLTCVEGFHNNDKVEFHFNPSEYTVAKTNKYSRSSKKIGNNPNWEFGGGDPRTVSLALLFDSSIERDDNLGSPVQKDDVRTKIDKLFSFMLIDKTLKQGDGVDSKMGRPPQCRLQWARDTPYHFTCYITSCSVKYIMFNQEGLPIRAVATLQIVDAEDTQNLKPQNPTSRGEPGRRMRQVLEGDRLDWIAFQEYGDANEWRRIAEANRLFDPLHVRPGMILAIPAR